MAITIIVEDGSIVPSANSFLSLADARTLAESLGITLPVDNDKANEALVQGGVYVNNQEGGLQGVRVSIDQTMCYPREGVVKYGFDVPNDSIPDEIKCSQVHAASQIGAGVNPYSNDAGKEVASQTVVGAVARTFFESGKTNSNISLTESLNCLHPLTMLAIGSGNQFTIRAQRA